MGNAVTTPEEALRMIAAYIRDGDWSNLCPTFGDDPAHCLANAAEWLDTHAAEDDANEAAHKLMREEVEKQIKEMHSMNGGSLEVYTRIKRITTHLDNLIEISRYSVHKYDCVYWEQEQSGVAKHLIGCTCGLGALWKKKDMLRVEEVAS